MISSSKALSKQPESVKFSSMAGYNLQWIYPTRSEAFTKRSLNCTRVAVCSQACFRKYMQYLKLNILLKSFDILAKFEITVNTVPDSCYSIMERLLKNSSSTKKNVQ